MGSRQRRERRLRQQAGHSAGTAREQTVPAVQQSMRAVPIVPPPGPLARFVDTVRSAMGDNKKRPISMSERLLLEKLGMDEQYAKLCAYGDIKDFNRRYKWGLDDFPKLIAIEGIESIGINWYSQSLIIGTELIDVEDGGGQLKELGHYIFTLSDNPPAYTMYNITRSINGYAHPHGRQNGAFCMSDGKAELLDGIVDGQFSVAARVLMTALRMRTGSVVVGVPFNEASLSNWPLKSEVQ